MGAPTERMTGGSPAIYLANSRASSVTERSLTLGDSSDLDVAIGEPPPRPQRVLLVSGSAPGTAHVGEILLARALKCLSNVDIVVASVLTRAESESLSETQRQQVKVFESPPHPPVVRARARAARLFNALRRRARHRHALHRLANDLRAFAEYGNFDKVWVILNAPTVVEAAARAFTNGKRPLHVQVWDDFNHLAQVFRVDRIARSGLARDFGRCLAHASSAAVICESMAERYQRDFGLASVVVRAGAPSPLPEPHRPTDRGEFRIGLSGSLYAGSAWQALLGALDLMDWTVGSAKFSLHIWSSHASLESRHGARILFHGWRPEHEVRAGLAACDALYLPQPFESHDANLSELSFPTKLSLYVGARKPLFIHAPQNASVAVFNRIYDIGMHCASDDAVETAACLKAFAASLEDPQRHTRQLQAVAAGVLSEEHFEKGLREMLGTPV